MALTYAKVGIKKETQAKLKELRIEFKKQFKRQITSIEILRILVDEATITNLIKEK
ncbi:MAG: hypothetical protein JJV88_01395 [Sulfurovum sp.]|nr:hypothetical protein [Sulfurovaceae bacterium]